MSEDAAGNGYAGGYEDPAAEELPAGTVSPGPRLLRTMRSAELADLARDVARTAIASRDLAGARDTASVLSTRIRGRDYPMISQDHRSAAISWHSGASQGSTCMTNRKVCS